MTSQEPQLGGMSSCHHCQGRIHVGPCGYGRTLAQNKNQLLPSIFHHFSTPLVQNAVFLFLYFLFLFLKKYIFDLEIYRNIPRPPCCRAAGTWLPCCRAAVANLQKKEEKKLRTGPWEPAARQRAAGLPGRPAAGRPAFFFCNLSLFAK